MASIINAGTTSNTALNMSADTSGTLDLQSNGTTMASVTSTGFNIGGVVASGFTMKNRIINGDMQIDQRNNGASTTPTTNGTYNLDRWRASLSQTSKFSVQQSSTAPTGFTKSILCTSLSAYTVGSSENFNIQQCIEGFNIADLGWGTANAQTVTLSFWVRSSLTGTFGGSLRNNDYNRSYPFSYTISAANTWEQKTITIAGDTTGTWNSNSNGGLWITFSLGAGSTLSGSAGSWAGSNFASATGATSVVGTNGATLFITGVQLERGSQATSFEWLPYGTELTLCQRYFQLIKFGTVVAQNTTTLLSNFSLFCPMRSSPSISKTSGSISIGDMVSAGYTTTSTPTLSSQYENNDIRVNFSLAGFTGLTAYRSYQHEPNGGSPSLITVSAEL